MARQDALVDEGPVTGRTACGYWNQTPQSTREEEMSEQEICTFPGCTYAPVETRYITNPAPPPFIYGLGICAEHEKMIPDDIPGRKMLQDLFLDDMNSREYREQNPVGGKPKPATVIERPETCENPGEWPPQGWPNCPTREEYQEAVRKMEQLTDAEPAWENPAGFRRDHWEMQTLLWDRRGREMTQRRNRMILDLGMEATADGEFNFATSITNPYSIGASMIQETREGEYRSLHGLIPRDPRWTGLCPLLAEAAGLEAIALCAGRFHDPLAVICMPAWTLLKDPGEMARCRQGRSLMGRSGYAPVLTRVMAHHGVRLHFIDACENARPMNEQLEELLKEL